MILQGRTSPYGKNHLNGVMNLKSKYLHIGARVPVWIKKYHSVGTSEIDPDTPSSSSQ